MRPSLPALARILPAAARTLSNRPDSPFSSAQAPTASRLTVDAPIRVFHWLFALSLVGAYLTGDSKWWRSSHIAFGYMMIALVAFRLVYGLVGPRHVRLSALLRRASGWSEWLQALKPGRRTLGRPAPQLQHLFTASVVLVLMMWIVPVFVTGYAALNEWDKPLGGDILETLHEFFANGFLLVIALHLAGLLLFSLVRRRNLAAPMLTGHAPGSGPAIVKRNRVWLGWLLAAGILAFGAWEWANAETVTGRTAGLGASQHTSIIWTLFSPPTIAP